MSIVWIAEKIESIISKTAFVTLFAASTSLILFLMGSFQDLTNNTLFLLLKCTGWAAAASILFNLYDIGLQLTAIYLESEHERALHKIIRNFIYVLIGLIFFMLQGYIVVFTNSVQ